MSQPPAPAQTSFPSQPIAPPLPLAKSRLTTPTPASTQSRPTTHSRPTTPAQISAKSQPTAPAHTPELSPTPAALSNPTPSPNAPHVDQAEDDVQQPSHEKDGEENNDYDQEDVELGQRNVPPIIHERDDDGKSLYDLMVKGSFLATLLLTPLSLPFENNFEVLTIVLL